MPRRKNVDETLAELENLITVWKENPQFSLGDLTLAELERLHKVVSGETGEIETVRTRLTGLIESRDGNLKLIATAVTRTRSGFRAVYGPDSRQYKQAGGTPTSERKRPVRKSKADK